ncbi:hypothetical protein GBA65_13900 [Rubrobacter marinus]|uniref:DUF8173 domain-containing protein n=1 Tax=Rubrobacter marinus TaxID=2653852 RepID=A0A6G8PYY7_9ACTN|nr:polymer-forming cytoskeletal protein [Rubrobacter marinus]QIN79423.1 hypothetical protein GBA65_13900 [Rubrobacter marinus]
MTLARTVLLAPALLLAYLVLSASPANAAALEKEIFGNVVVEEGEVEDEVSTAWGDVVVRGRVTGDVHSGFGDVVTEGPVGGDVEAGFGDVRVDGPVEGDVKAGFGNLFLERGARVEGEIGLGYGAVREQHPEASVGGGVRTAGVDDADTPPGASPGTVAKGVATLGFAAAALLLAVVAPRPLRASARRVESAPGSSLLVGIASVPVVIVGSVVLAFTGVGLLILPLAWPAYLVVLLFGALVVAYSLGRRVVLATGRYHAGDTLAAIVGALLVAAISLIPILGGLLLAGLVLLGTGAALSAAVARRPTFGPPRRPTYASYEDYLQAHREEK